MGHVRLLLIGLILLSAQIASAEKLDTVITKIVDGDTVWVNDEDGDRLKVRLSGIDAPETHLSTSEGNFSQGHWGEDATNGLRRMAPVGTAVTVDIVGLDKYERALGRIYRNGRDLNLEMIRLGLAIPYVICDGDACDHGFFKREKIAEGIAACQEARSAGKGLFDPADPLTEMPFEFRLRHQKRRPDKPVGDFMTKRLHAPRDYARVDLCQRIFFFKANFAKKVGYVPADEEPEN